MSMLSRAKAVLPFLLAACSSPSAPLELDGTALRAQAVPLTGAAVERITYQQARAAMDAPWSLTASDGSGLILARVDARAVFEGPLAFTELHLYFHNDQPRTREGTFQITLPPGAAVSRFAMETNGQMQEAEVVDKMTARRAYDDALHHRQDPALLEKSAGNQFTAKVFPIGGNTDKHIVISYSQELPGTPYVLPLRGLPTTARVDVHLDVLGSDGTKQTQILTQQNWKPDRDFVSTAQASVGAIAAGTLVAAQVSVAPPDAAVANDVPEAVTLLVDTSASRALGYGRYLHDVRALIAALAKDHGGALPIHVIAFDQDTQAIYSGPADGYGDAAEQALVTRGAAGASDLGQALAALAAHGTGDDRIVVVSDGVLTAGPTGAELSSAVSALAATHARRLDVVLAGGIRDDAAATALVRAGLPHAGAVLDLEADGGVAVAHELLEPVQLDVAIDVPGAAWVYPRTLPTARTGQRTMVYARMASPAQSVQVVIGGKTQPMGTAAVESALLERAVASAEIAELEGKLVAASDPEAVKVLRADIAKRSVAARVVSSQTAMLVLETDDDYKRYGIQRSALSSILAMGPNGVELTSRSSWIGATPTPVSDPWRSREQGPRPVAVAKPTKSRQELFDVDLDVKKEVTRISDPIAERGGTGTAMALDEGRMGKRDDDRAEGQYKMETTAADEAPEADAPRVGDSRRAAVRMGSSTGMLAPPPPPRARAIVVPMHMVVARPPSAPSPSAPDGAASSEGDGGFDNQYQQPWPPADSPSALVGPLATIEAALAKGDTKGALTAAAAWHAQEPGDVLALIGLGDSLEATHDTAQAARIYGSIIDLFPARADMRRFAGERLARLGDSQRWLAIDTYRRAVADRPDHITGHRLLAYALLRDKHYAEAFAAILVGVDTPIPPDRYRGADRVLAEDAGMIAAAYLAAEPKQQDAIQAELTKRHLTLATSASTRFILYWETDANDVDFHIQDARGGHAFFSNPVLRSGGSLYADITTGYGPECFNIPGTPSAGPYRLSINYYSQGPMGYGMGLLEVQRFDGKGGLTFEDRPYVIMHSQAFVDLGTYPSE